ncbi:MAG: adenylate/guanylate cyclase domain-containing protein [Alphaproteobacteria bacterium]
MSADVVGYSRLMGADEAGTLARLQALRAEIFDPIIAAHHGRIVKPMGDGTLVEFASAVNAVECAIEAHRAITEVNDGVEADHRITLRIGVHLGDIMVAGDDIYGDGVNIAARLQESAETGGVSLSDDVYRQVHGKLEADLEDLGDQSFKNIAKPVRVYRVRSGNVEPVASLPLPGKPSIAVLPFTNMSNDPDQECFSDGITEDIITALA